MENQEELKDTEKNLSSASAETEQPEEQRMLTVGEILVGVEFNPSNLDSVSTIKMLAAEMANVLTHEVQKYEQESQVASSDLKRDLYKKAIGDILVAQMMCVKVLTFKH